MRIPDVRYASRDSAGSIDLIDATPFMRQRRITAAGPRDADLEEHHVLLTTDN